MALGALKQKGIDEYVQPLKIAQYLDRPVSDLKGMGFFDGIPYIVNYQGQKKYRYDACLKKLSAYGLKPPCTTHPYAKIRPSEIVADLDVSPMTYLRLVRKGIIKEQPADDYGKFVYFRDYDWFLKNYVPSKNFKFLPKTLNVKDSATFIGTTPGKLRAACRAGKANIAFWIHSTTGRKRYKWMTRENIIQYVNDSINETVKKGSRLIKKEPLPDVLTTGMACVYMKISRRTLTKFIFMKLLHPEQVKVGARTRNLFKKSELDELCDQINRRYFYCEGKPYYNRFAIRTKFGKSNYWIDNLISGKCRVVAPPKLMHIQKSKDYCVMTVDEYNAHCAEVQAKGWPMYPMWGWVQEDVDAIVASGVNVDPKMELSDFQKKHLDKLNKTNRRAAYYKRHKAGLAAAKTRKKTSKQFVWETPVMDEFEVAIKAALYENELRAEDRRRTVYAERAKEEGEKNQLRKALGIRPVETIRLDNNTILKHSKTPCVITILYRRKGSDVKVPYKKYSSSRDELVYLASDQPVRMCKKSNPQMSIFLNIARVAEKIVKLNPKVPPSWIVLAHASSLIYDPSFIQKLEEVPSDVGAVAPFGYEHFLPDGTWMRCPNTYGMYSEYSTKDGMYNRRVAGTVSVTGSHDVAVLDGPFVAIRGGYLPILKNFGKLYKFGDGRGCVPYVVSMMMHRLEARMQQIEVDCSWCVDVNAPFTPLEWNQLEPKFVEIGKKVVTKGDLNPKYI